MRTLANFGELWRTHNVIFRISSLTFTRGPAKVAQVHQSSGEGAFCMRVAFGMCPRVSRSHPRYTNNLAIPAAIYRSASWRVSTVLWRVFFFFQTAFWDSQKVPLGSAPESAQKLGVPRKCCRECFSLGKNEGKHSREHSLGHSQFPGHSQEHSQKELIFFGFQALLKGCFPVMRHLAIAQKLDRTQTNSNELGAQKTTQPNLVGLKPRPPSNRENPVLACGKGNSQILI